jgi:hypothetical protein
MRNNKIAMSTRRTYPMARPQRIVQIGSMTAKAMPMSHNQIRSTVGCLKRIAGQYSTALALLLLVAVSASAQSVGTYIPAVPSQYLDNNGDPCNGCLLYSYSAGTTTPLSTYSDVALSVANANPVVLDSAGRATIFLSANSYKFVLKSSAGATIWTRDSIASVALSAASNQICDYRITLTSGTAVTTTDITAATTIYATPFRGNKCALYDGTAWQVIAFTEKSLSLGTDAADTNYDLFAYSASGVLTLERVAWSSATARGTALVFQDGVLVKSGDTTRRYLGTYRTTGTTGQTEDSLAKRFVWNYLNRIRRPLKVADATDTWAYTTDTWRQARASTANQIALVVGYSEDTIEVSARSLAANTNAGVILYTGIGEDATTAPLSGSFPTRVDAPAANAVIALPATLTKIVNEGYHFYTWLERSAATGTTTWLGDNGNNQNQQTGIWGYFPG